MKLLLIPFVIVLFTSSSTHRSENKYSLTVEVNGLRNSNGVLQVALYNKARSIPDEHYNNYFKLEKTEIKNSSAIITFADLPAGQYAVNILHDENSNGKIDKRVLFPKEGIGFSNFESIGLRNRPSFEKAGFDLHADKSITIKIIYM